MRKGEEGKGEGRKGMGRGGEGEVLAPLAPFRVSSRMVAPRAPQVAAPEL